MDSAREKSPAVLHTFVLVESIRVELDDIFMLLSHERVPVVTYWITCYTVYGDANRQTGAARSAMPPALILRAEWPPTCRLCCQVFCMMSAQVSRLLATAHQLKRPSNAACTIAWAAGHHLTTRSGPSCNTCEMLPMSRLQEDRLNIRHTFRPNRGHGWHARPLIGQISFLSMLSTFKVPAGLTAIRPVQR